MTRIHCALLGCLLALSMTIRLQAAVRVAVLEVDPKRTEATVALLVPKLTQGDRFAVVERQQIDKILREQQLSAMLGPQAVMGRISLGKILQADLLVFVRPTETGQLSHFEVAISETHQGLRLIRQSVDATAGEEATAAAISRLIDLAAEKHAQKIDEIFAVPPFVSDDLGFEFDHFKGAYARLIEGVLSGQKGVVVADLDEARAISREISQSSADNVHRPLPLYVLGRFRNDGTKSSRRVRLTLKLMRGEQTVASVTKADVPPDQVSAVLREITASFLVRSKTAPQAALDPRVEAAQLAGQAHLMQALGSWRETLDLIEASLLLDPDQPSLHLDAVEVLTKFTADANQFAAEAPVLKRPVEAARIDAYLRGLDHLEAYLRGTKIERPRKPQERADGSREEQIIRKFVFSLDAWGNDILRDRLLRDGVPPGASKLVPGRLDLLRDKFLGGSVGPFWNEYTAARTSAAEMYYRVLQDKANRKVVDETLWSISYFDDWGIALYLPDGYKRYAGYDPTIRRDQHLKLLADFAFLPNEAEVLDRMVEFPGRYETDPREVNRQPGYADFLRKAREIPNEGLHRKIDQLLAALEPTPPRSTTAQSTSARPTTPQSTKAQPKPASKPASAEKPIVRSTASKADPSDDVRFTPISFTVEGGDASERLVLPHNWLPAGKGIDFLWNDHEIYTMRRPGVLRRFGGRLDKIRIVLNVMFRNDLHVCFDGQYVWIAHFGMNGRMRLTVLDPDHETVVAVDAVQRLPACEELDITPLGPGRAVVVGYFGQTFAALVEVKPDVKPQTKVLHEFRHSPRTGDDEQWHDPDTTFRPRALFTLGESVAGESAKQSVVIWRSVDQANVLPIAQHPILLDAASGDVRALDEKFPYPLGGQIYVCAHDGVVDRIECDFTHHKVVLYRLGLSGVTSRDMKIQPEYNCATFEFGDALHFINSRWMVAGKDAGPFRQLKAVFPLNVPGPDIRRSENYGLVAWVNNHTGSKAIPEDNNIYRVEFTKPVAGLLNRP